MTPVVVLARLWLQTATFEMLASLLPVRCQGRTLKALSGNAYADELQAAVLLRHTLSSTLVAR